MRHPGPILLCLFVALAVAAPVRGASPEPMPSPGSTCAETAAERRATVYLSMDDGSLGMELWATDAAAEGVRLVADIDPDGSGDPELLGSVGDTLLFTADDGVHGRQLMATDGGPEGVIPLTFGPVPIESIRIPDDWDELDDPVEVATRFLGTLGEVAILTLGHGTGDIELWRTDGTPAGTSLVRSISPEGWVDVRPLGSAEGSLLFTDGSGTWITDGTAEGTRPSADAVPVGDGAPGPETPWDGSVEAGGHRFIFDWQHTPGAGGQLGAPAPNGPDRVWVAVEREPGRRSQRLRRLPAAAPGFGPASLGALGERIVVAAAERRRTRQSYPDIGVWVSDGTRRGTVRVARLPAGERSWWGDSIAVPWLLSAMADGTMLFTVRTGDELWRTDGTRAGTTRIATGRVAELLAVEGDAICGSPVG